MNEHTKGVAAPYVLYGMAGSLYTGKVRSYLRKQGIAYEERTAGDPRFRAKVLPVVGRWIIPVLQTPDGRTVQDGADIIDYFEQRGLARLSAYPPPGVHRVISLIFELFGGEGLLRPAMHYRWNFDDTNLSFLAADFSSALAEPGAAEVQRQEVFTTASARMRRATQAFGVTPDTAALVEQSYLEFLDLFDTHLSHSPYLLGGRPTIGDYGLIAPLYAHLGRDPYPATLMKQRAARVWRWVERMNAPEQGAGEYQNASTDLFDADAVPATLRDLLRFIALDYLPEVQAYVEFTNQWLQGSPHIPVGESGLKKPGERSIGVTSFAWRGRTLTVAVMPYRLYLLQRVQDAAQALPVADRLRLDQLFGEIGLAPLLTLKTTRRIERRQHLEVWGEHPTTPNSITS